MREEQAVQDHRDLRVWHDAQNLCVDIYVLSADFPIEERYGLTAQIRKILNIAESEAAEVMSELDIAFRLKFPGKEAGQALLKRYDQLLAGLERLRQRVLEGHDS